MPAADPEATMTIYVAQKSKLIAAGGSIIDGPKRMSK
jgi:hypothetical protein